MYGIGILVTVCIFTLSSLAGCNRESKSQLNIIATTSIIADVMEQVLGYTMEESGDRYFRLDVVIPSGVNSHSFVLTPSAAGIIEEADLIVLNGLGFEEGAVKQMIQKSSTDIMDLSLSVTPLAKSNLIQESHLDGEDEHGEYDPHHWLNPLNVIKWVDAIVDKLSFLDEDNRDFYMENARKYKTELMILHQEIKLMMSELEPEERNVLVGHESITYFAQEYGLNIHGSIVLSSGTRDISVSSKNLARLKDLTSRERINAIILDETGGEAILSLAREVAGGGILPD